VSVVFRPDVELFRPVLESARLRKQVAQATVILVIVPLFAVEY